MDNKLSFEADHVIIDSGNRVQGGSDLYLTKNGGDAR